MSVGLKILLIVLKFNYVPVLGICMGMQQVSEEAGSVRSPEAGVTTDSYVGAQDKGKHLASL